MITQYTENHKFKDLLTLDLLDDKAKLSNYGITNYTINLDGTVDVDGDVNLYNRNLTEILFKFGVVKGYFDCGKNKLFSLEGSPKIVKGNYTCQFNRFTSLQGAPTTVKGYFDCSDNYNLISLEGLPKEISGNFYCFSNNKLLETYDSKEDVIEYIKANCKIGGKIFL